MSAALVSENATQRFVRTSEPADLNVILVNYNTAHLMQRCIDALRQASQGLSVGVVIVDNASRDGSADLIRAQFPDCHLIANEVNVGFGRANNQALEFCSAPYVLLLNVDAFVFPDTLTKCIQHMKSRSRCGVLGARLVNEAGRGTYVGRSFPDPWKNFLLQTGLRRTPLDRRAPHDALPEGGSWECDWVVGCFYMVRREVLDKVGLFDPRYFLYYEEVDHCLAVKQAGWTVECLATASVFHIGGASAESEGELTSAGRQISELQIESELLFFRKHRGLGGLLLTVSLTIASDAIKALKWILRGRQFSGLKSIWRNSLSMCKLMIRTRFGAHPTR